MEAIEWIERLDSNIYNTMVIKPINFVTANIEKLQRDISFDIDTSYLQDTVSEINRASVAINELNNSLRNINTQPISQMTQVAEAEETQVEETAESSKKSEKSKSNKLRDFAEEKTKNILSLDTLQSAVNISDQMTQSTIKLNMINDGRQSNEELLDMVYNSALSTGGSAFDTAELVSMVGSNSGDAFGSTQEMIAFTTLMQKELTASGVSTQEISDAMQQLSQAMATGVLSGEQLNSIFSQAPRMVQDMADYLDLPPDKIREMADEGAVTSDMLIGSVFNATGKIETRFGEMPKTWAQTWDSLKNGALIAFAPIFQKIGEVVSSTQFQDFVSGVIDAMQEVGVIVSIILDAISQVGTFISDNWSVIEPIVWGVVAALAAYAVIAGIVALIEGVKAAVSIFSAGATAAQTGAQNAFNASLLACPIVWIVLAVLALIVALFALSAIIAENTGIAQSGLGVIMGSIYVIIALVKNLAMVAANVVMAMTMAFMAFGGNLFIAFQNVGTSIKMVFYSVLSTVLSVIETICKELNRLPFISFDYSGVTNKASEYAAKSAAAAGEFKDYNDIGAAFNKGLDTYKTFENGWLEKAFNEGAGVGDGLAGAIGNTDFSKLLDQMNPENPTKNLDTNLNDYTTQLNNTGMPENLGNIADSTGSIKDSMNITSEDLKYLRDIAEQETVNRFTLADVSIKQTNNNNVSSKMDLDGLVTGLTDAVNQAADSITEGVHA